jgi:hypothetical protein
VRLAARGARDLDGALEAVPNLEESRLLQAQAARVYATALAGAVLLTGLGLLVAM